MNRRLINTLEGALKGPLPGEEVHRMLMPAGRPYHRVTRTDSAVPGRGRVRQSAVLLLLSEADSLVTPFIRRAADRGPHSNQIALPGGAKERHDRSIIHTALREAEEEIGLSPGIVAVTGTLTPLYIDVSNYLITPVVGVYDGTSPFPWSSLRPNPLEVAEIIPVPLCELDETRTERVVSSRRGTITVPSYHFGGRRSGRDGDDRRGNAICLQYSQDC